MLGFGGAAGGGKTALLIGLACMKHQRSLILRREAKQARGVIDYAREVLGGLGRFNENTGVWRGLPGGRQIEFGGCKDPGDEQAHKGRAKDFLGIDEADQFPEHVVRFLMGWVRTTIPDQPCQTVLCFNPPSTIEGRWLLDFFAPWINRKHPNPAQPGEARWFATLKDGREVERPDGKPFVEGGETIQPRSRTFIPSRVQDNPALMTTGYLSTLLSLPEPLRSQLAYGDMEAGLQDDAWQLFPTEWVKAAQARWTETPPDGLSLTCIGVDVAHGGADRTVVAPRYGNWFAPLKKYQGAETDSGEKAAHLVLREYRDGSDALINVDAIGYGASCADALQGKLGKKQVQAVNVGATPDPPVLDRSRKYKLARVRSAMYWKLREALDPVTGEGLALPPDRELFQELTAMRYEARAGAIVVEEKDEIKKCIARSPDAADAVALAHWQGKLRKLCVFV